jgi:hypothetical protein
MNVIAIQRWENAAIAVIVAALFVSAGFTWWWLLVLFLAFDLSAIGFVWGPTIGGRSYNAVHNYIGPAILIVVYFALSLAHLEAWLVGLIGGCWAFHVAVDRAVGYGLRLPGPAEHTHLGLIGRAKREARGR